MVMILKLGRNGCKSITSHILAQ